MTPNDNINSGFAKTPAPSSLGYGDRKQGRNGHILVIECMIDGVVYFSRPGFKGQMSTLAWRRLPDPRAVYCDEVSDFSVEAWKGLKS